MRSRKFSSETRAAGLFGDTVGGLGLMHELQIFKDLIRQILLQCAVDLA